MIIVLLLFFKSICLYCQRLVLHIHDRWINPKNVRLLKEAAEAQGSKFQIEEYRQVKKSKKRRYTTNSTAAEQTDRDSCRFCANTPQGYCRHHFHLQELHIQKQQRQQKFWCPLSGAVAGPNRSTDYKQLRKIKRELKRNIEQQQQQQQQLKLSKTTTSSYEYKSPSSSNWPPSPSPSTSSHLNNDSDYQTLSNNDSASLPNVDYSELEADSTTALTSYSPDDFIDIDLSTPSASLVETTYSFETCRIAPNNSSPTAAKNSSSSSFVSYEYSTLSTTYL